MSPLSSHEQFISETDNAPVLRTVIGDASSNNPKTLNLVLLGLEDTVGYGPMDHTAALFLDLVSQAALRASPQSLWTISLHLYNAKSQEYPSTWNEFAGIILPGSKSSAYEDDVPWIQKLKDVIQQVIVAKEIPTLGICFGHQILAHSFQPDGLAAKIAKRDAASENTGGEIDDRGGPSQNNPPASMARAGRVFFRTNQIGCRLLGKDVVDLYATHGDQVVKLPNTAISLGGDGTVPVHAAVYYATSEQAECVRRHETGAVVRPYALTFQSHLEYATSEDLGLKRTLEMILDQMVERGDLQEDDRRRIQEDVREKFAEVQEDSKDCMVEAGRLLGWFPVP